MAGKTDAEHLAHLKETLGKLIDHVESLAIERDACEELAVAKVRSTYPAVERAKREALADPETRKRMRDQYSEMRAALEDDALAAFFEGQLQDLPTPEKPN